MHPDSAGALKSEGIGENIGEEELNVESTPSPRSVDNGKGSGGGTDPDNVDEARAAGLQSKMLVIIRKFCCKGARKIVALQACHIHIHAQM